MLAFGGHDLVVGDLLDDAVGVADGGHGFVVAHRIADADRAGDRLGVDAVARRERLADSCGRTGSRRCAWIDARRGMRSIQPCACASRSALPNALVLPRLPAGTTIQSGGVPVQVLEQLPDDRLLPFDAERVDRVDEVDAEAVARFAHEAHGGVEVAAHLQARARRTRASAPACRWRSFPPGRTRWPAARPARRRRRARRWCCRSRRRRRRVAFDAHGLRHGHGHAAILERAGGVLAFVLEEQSLALDTAASPPRDA